jgi:signal transduction histidine kinase/PAS domain-containing protein
MDADWITSQTARRILVHWADPRPAWLWSGDGQRLLWRNAAARYFHGKIKKSGLKLVPDAAPIKGQVPRLIRLGSPGRSSLSRIQFLAGGKPVSDTCTVTPLEMPGGSSALLVVGVDPIEPELLHLPAVRDDMTETLFPPRTQYLLVDGDRISGGAPGTLERFGPIVTGGGLGDLSAGTIEIEVAGRPTEVTQLRASLGEAILVVFRALDGEAEEPEAGPIEAAVSLAPSDEPLLPMGLPPVAENEAVAEDFEMDGEDEVVSDEPHSLSSLFDRLAGDDDLYSPLDRPEATEAEEFARARTYPEDDFPPPAVEPESLGDVQVPWAADTSGSENRTDEAEFRGTDPEPEPVVELAPVVEPEDSAAPEIASPAVELETIADDAVTASAEETISAIIELADDSETPAIEVPQDAEAQTPLQQREVAEPGNFEPAAEAAPADVPTLWRVTGRRYAALSTEDDAADEIEVDVVAEPDAPIAEFKARPDPVIDDAPFAFSGETPEPATEPDGAADVIEDLAGSEPPAVEEPSVPQDHERVERVSRYNFDQLSRILNDRVGGEDASASPSAEVPAVRRAGAPQAEGQLVSLAGETFILNRLPLGILVFRDQQVLFANRSITEMVGYSSIEELRTAGLGAIFPATDETLPQAGPVNHLMQKDGTLVPVTARLQSISWQGRPALMLSASMTEVRTSHEAAVRAWAELLAETRNDGFVETTRAGVIKSISTAGKSLVGRQDEYLPGKPLSSIVEPRDIPALKEFLERPARFAESTRPALVARAVGGTADLMLFAQGQAGIVAGYFGLIRKRDGGGLPIPRAANLDGEIDTSVLSRLSRGVRRPLNTIIGFADLIRSAAFGATGNDRYLEYAKDIKNAGMEIAALVDELDDFARLKDGRYDARPADLDIGALLDSCIVRVRGQAGLARVLVRSAVSERLPRIRADRASLGQAVLNLLSSAIGQTPPGGSVILSAQQQDDGAVAVHIRDSGSTTTDMGERFVVFRDGTDREGTALAPVRSSVGLALTRSLLAVNSCELTVDPAGGTGLLFSVSIPFDLVVEDQPTTAV